MKANQSRLKGRIARVRKNLRHGLSLAWAASHRLFIRYTAVGIFNAVMAPIAVLLGAMLARAQDEEGELERLIVIYNAQKRAREPLPRDNGTNPRP